LFLVDQLTICLLHIVLGADLFYPRGKALMVLCFFLYEANVVSPEQLHVQTDLL
jgi:hypothetical protein